MKKNLLIVCFNYRDIDKISKLDLTKYANVVVASDELRVHKQCEKLEAIDQVTFLHKPISYPGVSVSVMKMIDKVNIYLDKVTELGIFSKNELFWTYHVEGGGYTTQKLQDALLAIESAYLILNENMINEVIIIGSDNELSIKALKRLAFIKGYKISSYNHRYALDKKSIRGFIRPMYLLFRSLICKIRSEKFNYVKKSKIILFQICGSSSKHVQNALFPQKIFLKGDFTPLNIIWGNTKEVKKINNRGYKAIAIEYYLKYSDFFISLYKMILIFTKSKILKDLFYQTNTFTYKGIDLKDIIYETVVQYLYTDGPENYRYRVAVQRFASECSEHVVAIKYCAVKSLTQSSILSEIMEDKYLKFDYDLGVRMRDQYEEHNSKKYQNFLHNNFIRFSPNEILKKNLMEDVNVDEKSVIIFGNGRANNHFENLKIFSKADSKAEIGIKKDYDIYILLDFQAPSAGYNSVEEIVYLSNTIVDFVKRNRNIALIIKPYPSIDMSLLSNIILNKTDNIYLVDKKLLPDHALNIADVIFCKFSTLGVEGMIYDTQVVSILLDNEKLFKVFGDSAEYIYKKEELIFFLETSLNSKDNFIKWKNSFKEKRKKFLKEYYPKQEKSSDEIIVETITKILKH